MTWTSRLITLLRRVGDAMRRLDRRLSRAVSSHGHFVLTGVEPTPPRRAERIWRAMMNPGHRRCPMARMSRS